MPRFTVVIPTRDRPRSLERCLAALNAQDCGGDFEIVVVDDGSRDAATAAAVVDAVPRARLVRTFAGGAVQARNRGVLEADADIVVFLDDDCEPDPPWARLLVAAVDDGAAVAAGRCSNADPTDVFGEATQVILDYLTRTAQGEDGVTTAFAPTYNLACRRKLMLELPFDESYENSGADRDWCARLESRGLAIRLVPSAGVRHRQLLDARRFLRKHYWYGRGSRRFRRRHKLGLEVPAFYANLLRDGFARGPLVGVAVGVAQVATAAGFATESLSASRLR